MRINLSALLPLSLLACTPVMTTSNWGEAPDASVEIAEAPDADVACLAPDVLVVLDRTMSMVRRPDGTAAANTPEGRAETKWSIAIAAIESVTAQLGSTIQFGLELFPRDPGGDSCVTLAQKLDGIAAQNPLCDAADVLVTPTSGGAGAIASSIDAETTRLCRSTATGAALATAAETLALIQQPNREQYVLFVSDGKDTCDPALVLANADLLADRGVQTFVLAFDGSGTGINQSLLNDLACAGGTAKGLVPCTLDINGRPRATIPDGEPLYLTATDATGLSATLGSIAGDICCGCVL